MIITDDLSELDAALQDPGNSFLLLFGNGEKAKAIHDETDAAIHEDWRKTFLIEKADLLKDGQKDWYKSDNEYTTLAPIRAQGQNRAVFEQKPLSELCESTGETSPRKIQSAFARAEK